ncbi:hypothetical protein D3C78_1068640 [compost metagenome]
MQRAMGQAGDVVGMADNGGVQGAVFDIAVAHVDGRKNVAAGPGLGVLHQQHRGGAVAQQFPVVRGQQGLLQRVVGDVLLDHQPAAFRLLLGDNGAVQIIFPGLPGRGAIAFLAQTFGEIVQLSRVITTLVAHQQMQMGLRGLGDQLGSLQCESFRLVGVHNYEDATGGLHDRLPDCASVYGNQL